MGLSEVGIVIVFFTSLDSRAIVYELAKDTKRNMRKKVASRRMEWGNIDESIFVIGILSGERQEKMAQSRNCVQLTRLPGKG